MEEQKYGQGQRVWSCGVVYEICFSGMQRTDKSHARRLGRVDVTLACKVVSLDLILPVMRVWRGACVCTLVPMYNMPMYMCLWRSESSVKHHPLLLPTESESH